MAPPTPRFSAADACDLLIVRAFEAAGHDSPLWTADDARWATRLARDGGNADAQAYLAARARHALQRLQPREPRIGKLRGPARWRPAWAGWAALLGWILGLAIDQVGSSQQINLLAPPVWGLLVWNGVVGVAALAWWLLRRPAAASAGLFGLRAGLQRWLHGGASHADGATPADPLQRFALAWAAATAPAQAARATLLLHVAAVAVALGLASGLYLRGLVLDYRAGWQSTFIEAGAVQAWLDVVLAPASRVSGIEVPAAGPLRVLPGQAAQGPAAPWIHLQVLTLLLFVVLPRGLLAAWAARRARRCAEAITLPLHEPYFQRLLLARESRAAQVLVLTEGPAPEAAAALALRDALAQRLGPELQLRLQPQEVATAEGSAPPDITADITLLLPLLDLSATPEADRQGRWLATLREHAPGAVPLLLAVDTAAFRRRFAHLPQRIAERETLWRRFAAEQGVELLLVELGAP